MTCAFGTGLLCSTDGHDGISKELMLSGNSMNNHKNFMDNQELREQPGIAGLPVLDWKPDHGQPTQRTYGGCPELSQRDSAVPHGDWPGDPGRNERPKDLHMVGQVDASGHSRWDYTDDQRPMSSSPHKDEGSARFKEPHGDRAGIPGHLGGDRASNRENPGGEVFDVLYGQRKSYGHCGNRENPHGDQPSHVYGLQWGDPGVGIHEQLRSDPRDDGHGRDQRRRSRSPQEALTSTNPTMPKLPAPNSKNASVEVTDWLAEITWDHTMQETMRTYQTWLASTPLERLQFTAPQPNLEHLGHPQEVRRLEQRATTLLGAIPEDIAQRELWPSTIMYKVLRCYFPGGWKERTQLLHDELANTTAANDSVTASSTLRIWKR